MSRDARKQGLTRRHRFSERGSFGPVLRSPRKMRGRLAILHVLPARKIDSRLGIALTRRLVPLSVDRNRVKRILRESFRHHPLRAAGLDCVVTLREKFEAAQLAELRREVLALFDRAQLESRRG